MIDGKKVIAVIPARSGSKRIKNKNIKEIAGKPLIEWTILAACNSKLIDLIVVSSDSDDILSLASNLGVSVNKRPENLSSDNATTDGLLLYLIEELECTEDAILVLLQPTSPLRTADQIDASLEIFKGPGVEGVISVCECEHSPLWSNTLPSDLCMDNFISEKILKARSQDLPKYYRLNGAIFCYKVCQLLLNRGRFYSKNTFAYLMPPSDSIDIDTLDDFLIAESLLAYKY